MIYIKDDFLDINVINLLNKDKNVFQEVKTPGKSFWVKMPSDKFMELVCEEICKIENVKITTSDVKKGNKYLKSLDKQKFTSDYFIKGLLEISESIKSEMK